MPSSRNQFRCVLRPGRRVFLPVYAGGLLMSRNNGAYRRLSGLLRLNGRSAVLETADGSLIYVTSSEELAPFHDQQVVVEGQMSGADRLALTWIAPATT